MLLNVDFLFLIMTRHRTRIPPLCYVLRICAFGCEQAEVFIIERLVADPAFGCLIIIMSCIDP